MCVVPAVARIGCAVRGRCRHWVRTPAGAGDGDGGLLAKKDGGIAEIERRNRLQFAGFIGLLAVCALGAVGYFAYDRLVMVPRREAAAAQATDANREAVATARARVTSVAVLPFAASGDDQSEPYFADGMAAQLAEALARVQGLKVVSPESSFRFRDTTEPSRAIGLKLDAAHLLQARMQRGAGRVRLDASLVRVSDGNTIWSQRYDRPQAELFALQDRLAADVGAALQMPSAAAATGQAGRPPGGSLQAYDAVLKGNDLARQKDIFSLRNAADAYQQAVALDPRYALAQARLAQAKIELLVRFPPSAEEARAQGEQARAAAAAALALDPASAEAHRAQAAWLGSIALDQAGALSETTRAQALAPQDATLLNALAVQQTAVGRLQEAVENHRRALALDPLSVLPHYNLGAVYLRLADYAEAEHVLREALELQPDISVVRAFLAIAVFQQNRTDEAIGIARSEPDPLWKTYALAMAYWAADDRAASEAQLQALIRDNARDAGTQIAGIYAQRDDEASMFKWLQQARAAGDPGIVEIRYMPFVSRYADDPRFVALAKDLDLMPDAADAAKGPPGKAATAPH